MKHTPQANREAAVPLSYLSEVEDSESNTFISYIKELYVQFVSSRSLQIAVFLALGGIFSSGYGMFRLISDSHLVCSQGEITHFQEVTDSNSDDERINSALELNDQNFSNINSSQEDVPQHANASEDQLSFVTIDVSGAVQKPGLYQIKTEDRLGDVIAQAGGLLPAADAVEIAQVMNLAQKLEDGQKVYIPYAGEELRMIASKQEAFSAADLSSRKPANTSTEREKTQTQTENGTSSESKDSTEESSEKDSKVSINTATTSQLMELKGIGEKRAADIVAGRPYDAVSDLLSREILTNSLYDDLLPSLKL